MAGQVLGDFTNQNGRERLVIMLAQFSQRPRRSNDDKAVDGPIENVAIENFDCAGGSIFFLLAVWRIGRIAVITSTGSLVVLGDRLIRQSQQRR